MNTQKIFVGISGGVDSVTSAFLLKKQGYDVEGVFIRGWQPDFIECSIEEDLKYAMRNCAKLSIPFRILDLSKEYKQMVIDPFIQEYKNGNTPNPDILCNRNIKFGLFLEWSLKKGANKIATGHYAKISYDGSYHLLSAADYKKDQTYFLWTLNQSELENIIFPLADINKTDVRGIAEKNELPSANRKDSTGICFIGEVDMKDFLSKFIKLGKGDVLLENEIIDSHDGLQLYVEGQRYKSSKIKDEYIVVSKDYNKNVLIVSNKEDTKSFTTKEIAIVNKNFINPISMHETYLARLRHGGEKMEVKIKDNTIEFKTPQLYSKGQSVVFYTTEGECLGGAIMSS